MHYTLMILIMKYINRKTMILVRHTNILPPPMVIMKDFMGMRKNYKYAPIFIKYVYALCDPASSYRNILLRTLEICGNDEKNWYIINLHHRYLPGILVPFSKEINVFNLAFVQFQMKYNLVDIIKSIKTEFDTAEYVYEFNPMLITNANNGMNYRDFDYVLHDMIKKINNISTSSTIHFSSKNLYTLARLEKNIKFILKYLLKQKIHLPVFSQVLEIRTRIMEILRE